MQKRKLAKLFHSVSFKLVAGILLALVPLIILLMISNGQSRRALMSQVEITREDLLQSYVSQIDGQLSGASAYAYSLYFADTDPLLAATSQDEATVQYAKRRLQAGLRAQIDANNLMDGFYTLLHTRHGDIFLASTSNTAQRDDHDLIREHVTAVSDTIDTSNIYSNDSLWHVVELDSRYYLLQTVAGEDAFISGSYVNLSQLLDRIAGWNREFELYILPSGGEEALMQDLPRGSRLIVQPSAVAPYVLAEVISETEILAALPFMQRYTQLVSLLLLLEIPLMFLLVHLVVTKPLRKLIGSMRRLQKGELEHRIPLDLTSSEFMVVNETFNGMAEDIQSLKINVYEEALKAQRSQLRNLQLQIRPHFLINSLNMVYNAVENERYAVAQRLILHSVDYFRYMTKVDEDLVRLNEELDHVRTYLDIQSIRYEGLFTHRIQVDRLVEDMLVPPLIIQTFVENTMKYAIRMSESVELQILVEAFEIDFAPYARITVRDTGNGYPGAALDTLCAGGTLRDDTGEHIGIRNVTRRLEILFKGRASWRFFNEGGAVSELVLPAVFEADEL